jgi:hypothetical protein
MQNDAGAWFSQRTSHWRDWPLRQLMTWKHGQATRISVVIAEVRLVKGCYERLQAGALLQFVREDGELRRRPRPVPAVERPPARSVRVAAAR